MKGIGELGKLYCVVLLSIGLKGLQMARAESRFSNDTGGSGCGVTQGCFWVPSNCSQVPSKCDYILTWVRTSGAVNFEIVALSLDAVPWVGVGLNDVQKMSRTSVVDCIVNASDNNRVIVQMSRNVGHKNLVLNDRYLGLVSGSLKGSYNGSHISCSFGHQLEIDPHNPESSYVSNLTSPHYVIFARGSADGAGQKKIHTDDPAISADPILFLNYTNGSCSIKTPPRPLEVRIHAILMILSWMILASIGIVTSRYMKSVPGHFEFTLLGSAAWFQIHRICMTLTFLLTAVGFVIIFFYLEWEFKPPQLHPLLGLIVACLVTLNPLIAMVRPHPESSRRIVFRLVHGLIGHGVHLLAVAAMFFGVHEARLPSWCKWVVIAFGGWRLLADFIFTTSASAVSKFDVREKQEGRTLLLTDASDGQNRLMVNWRTTAMVIYFSGTVALALSLIVAINLHSSC